MNKRVEKLSMNMVIDRFVFNNNQITLFPSFTCIPKTDIELLKTDITLYGVVKNMITMYLIRMLRLRIFKTE